MSAADFADHNPRFRVAPVDYASSSESLHAVRDAVFAREQGVPAAIERDALDPDCVHVLARDLSGEAIGTARMAPPGQDLPAKIGRMAVLEGWRGRGVGAALLRGLLHEARLRGWHEVVLHAQAPVIGFYRRYGFAEHGPRFMEADIEHQAMRLVASGAFAVTGHSDAAAAATAIALGAQRLLCIRLRDLEPALLEAPALLQAVRGFVVGSRMAEVRILLQAPEARPSRAAALVSLAQRLPSRLQLRAAGSFDRAHPSACVVNDTGGYYFRPVAAALEGEADLAAPGRARQLRTGFLQAWERSRPLTEFRALRL